MRVIDKTDEENEIADLHCGDVLKCTIGDDDPDYWVLSWIEGPKHSIKNNYGINLASINYAMFSVRGDGLFCDKKENTRFMTIDDLLEAVHSFYDHVEKVDAALVVQREEC